jgi:large subunit ribosomal protein L22
VTVRINADRFKRAVEASGKTVEELAASMPGASESEKKRKACERKVRNWMRGSSHPNPRVAEMDALAGAMGVPRGRFCCWTSTYRFARSSERKSRLVVDAIRGMGVEEASSVLRFSPRRAAVMVNKALQAAVSDAEVSDADLNRLVVSEARADEGAIIKRFQPKDRGRAHPIQKRTSHIVVSVEEAD